MFEIIPAFARRVVSMRFPTEPGYIFADQSFNLSIVNSILTVSIYPLQTHRLHLFHLSSTSINLCTHSTYLSIEILVSLFLRSYLRSLSHLCEYSRHQLCRPNQITPARHRPRAKSTSSKFYRVTNLEQSYSILL